LGEALRWRGREPEPTSFQAVAGFLCNSSSVPGFDDARRFADLGYTGMFVAPWDNPPKNNDPGI